MRLSTRVGLHVGVPLVVLSGRGISGVAPVIAVLWWMRGADESSLHDGAGA